MNKIFFGLIGYIFNISNTFADDAGILGGTKQDTITATDLRNGDIHTEDIGPIISGVIDFLMGFAGTIAIIFIIIGGYKIALGSLEQDKTKGKETIFMALAGFALAALSAFIIRTIIDNF